MTVPGLGATQPAFLAYVLAFGVAAIVCVLSVPRARTVVDAETRRGLTWLLLLCGGWASAHVGFLVASSRDVQTAFYVVGLIVGFAAVGAWLYFCSAYTGRTYHRNPAFRWSALGVYGSVVTLKLTNPIHGLYYSTHPASEPFAHLAVQHGTLHWIAMGLAYALAAVGYFMLVERFLAVGQDTTPLVVLVGLTGLPLIADVVGIVSPRLIDMTYEPLGVAAFAVGVLYLYLEEFQAVQLAGSDDRPMLFLDADGRVREYNRSARQLFPDLAGAIGSDPTETVPVLQDVMDCEQEVLEVRRDGDQRYYRVSRTPITAGDTELGTLLGLEDVTEAETSRRAIERERERLDQFASVVAHDLRNPLNVADGRLELAREAIEEGTDAEDHLDSVADAHDRMATLIDDLLTLAREGRDIDETTPVAVDELTVECWETVDAGEATIAIEDPPTVVADPERLQQLLENLFRNAVEHGGDDVRITVGALDGDAGFFVADDGPGIPESERETVFEPGETTHPEGTGFGLAIVQEIVDAHDWSIAITDATGGGARFEIRT